MKSRTIEGVNGCDHCLARFYQKLIALKMQTGLRINIWPSG